MGLQKNLIWRINLTVTFQLLLRGASCLSLLLDQSFADFNLLRWMDFFQDVNTVGTTSPGRDFRLCVQV